MNFLRFEENFTEKRKRTKVENASGRNLQKSSPFQLKKLKIFLRNIKNLREKINPFVSFKENYTKERTKVNGACKKLKKN